MFLKEALLLLAGLAAGSTVAAGVYAFLDVYKRQVQDDSEADEVNINLLN